MKRSSFIDLGRMRKKLPSFSAKPVALAISAALISACGSSKEEVVFVSNVEDCVDNTSLNQEQCNIAYQQALEESRKTGPKYNSLGLCESEFGINQCVQQPGTSFFMPFMAGFIVNELLFDRDRKYYSGYYNPVYRYYRPYSRHHDLMMLADGTSIGKYGKSSYKVSKSATKPKPAVTRTVSRGGFGSTASAKSNWGGGKAKSSKGWGG